MVIARGAVQLQKLRVVLEIWEITGIVDGLWEIGLRWVHRWVLAMCMLAGDKTAGMREWFEGRLNKTALGNIEGLREEFEGTMKEFLWIEEIHSSTLESMKS